MSVVSAGSGHGRLHKAGENIIWVSNYLRGKQFVGAALMVAKQPGAYNYVVLHLLCTGIEVLLKGLLLQRNFKKYRPKLKEKYGHDLAKLVDAASREFGIKQLRPDVNAELTELNKFYSTHLTRYAGLHDIFIDHRSIRYSQVFRRLHAVIRLSERAIRKSPDVLVAIEFQIGS